MFAKPRPKKNALAAPPPRRKRKAAYAIEEISFDDDARADYLTGFHKRKVQRQKEAQEVAIEKARQEKIAFRKKIREERQQAVEEHVQQVNDALRAARLASGEADDDEDDEDSEEWHGFEDESRQPEFVDHEEEYIDEEKYTTVTVEAVDIDRDGMHRLHGRGSGDENSEGDEAASGDSDSGDDTNKEKDGASKKKQTWPKKKKKKFRYENKIERRLSQQKQKATKRMSRER